MSKNNSKTISQKEFSPRIKKTTVCADVRSVLREVFRELDYLPPLAGSQRQRTREVGEDGDCTLPKVEPWMYKYDTEYKEIWQREGDLKHHHAKRISREPLPNIHKLYAKQKLPKVPSWKNEKGMLQRRDLMPSIVQNAGLDESLWVKNILNRSSGDLAEVEVKGSRMRLPVQLTSPRESNFQSMSIGEIISQPPPLPPPVPPAPPMPEYIICIPPQLDFINFSIGQLHTKSIRLVNVSKFECRLSVRPPGRLELDIELCGPRGLTVSAGAAAELKVHFRPRDVRVLRDMLLVRVSTGRSLVVPISCYMLPPLLDILVPAVPPTILSYSPVEGNSHECGGDVLELGARLLGDVHSVRVLFHCEAAHAAFFLLTEDAWLEFCLDVLTSYGSLLAESFVVQPAWWRGGGDVRGRVWCRARAAGLHTAALRVLSSTAVVRPLHLLADSLYFRPNHVTVEAQEKDYDICSDDDPNCEYFVHLGTAFPHQSLSTAVKLVNHSPVVYSYYWSVRPWGVCSCWEEEKSSRGSLGPEDDSERLCVGAKEARDMEHEGTASPTKFENAHYVRVEPMRGSIAPRSSCSLHVCAPDVGSKLGTQRAVLMLILKDIPKESFPIDYDPAIVKINEIEAEPIPGIKSWTREVCEVVCAQMEVWWEVAPVRFVLDPPVLPVIHSRRVQSVEVLVRATQLFGNEMILGTWQVPQNVPAPPPANMTAAQSCAMTLRCLLPVLPNDYPQTDIITLKTPDGEWQSQCAITRQCETRHPALRPARVWLGVVAPGAHMNSTLLITNDTHQHICWWATPYRWVGENEPSGACAGRAPCPSCQERACSCALLKPSRGALSHGFSTTMYYDVNAPEVDGCVATLVQARRTAADVCRVAGGRGAEARAALLNYRVLAPRLMLRALPCFGDKKGECGGCMLDEGALGSERGTATLRPREALTLSRLACYRVRVTNLTPIPTAVTWDPPLEDKVLNVVFIPMELQVPSYGEVEFQVVLDARQVCGRRVFVHRARVMHAYHPIYLIIDTEIAGLEIICEVPIGEEAVTDSTLIMRRSQKEEFPWDADTFKPRTSVEMFQEEDRKRAVRADNICHCHCALVYIAPVKRARPPPSGPDDYPPVEIVWEPPPKTRVCPCFTATKPILQEHKEPFSLQFKQTPLKTVRSRKVTLRNESALAASWSAALRRWPRRHTRTLATDAWAEDVRAPGIVMQCCPPGGVLSARESVVVVLHVYADCWGLYHDQLLLKIDKVEPIVLDVWVEAVGTPLLFALNLADAADSPVVLWMSASDPERTLRVKNKSRAELFVHAYVLTEHGHEQSALPFRLYLRFFDVPPRTCACVTAIPSESCFSEESVESKTSSYDEEMDTGIEIFLAPDYGRQGNAFFKITPERTTVPPSSWAEWKVTLVAPPFCEVATPTTLLFRPLPVVNRGEGWFRPDPFPQVVKLRQAVRYGRLKVSARELHVKLCALDLPFGDVLRVRKLFRIQNVGSGPLDFTARTKLPWSLVVDEDGRGGGGGGASGAGCGCGSNVDGHRECQVALYLLPRSSMELCVEVRVATAEVWPEAAASPCQQLMYEQWRRIVTKLRFYDSYNVLLTVPLHLELEYPIIFIEPAVIDFGFVTDGDTRKSYFTVSHSSRTATIDMAAEWAGGEEFRLWPRDFSLQPGGRERLYIQYTARWCGAPSEGCARVAAACGARAWCRAAARARAAPARDGERRLHAHDHTDDKHLLPADLLQLPLPTRELIGHEYPRNISDIGEGSGHEPSPVKYL